VRSSRAERRNDADDGSLLMAAQYLVVVGNKEE